MISPWQIWTFDFPAEGTHPCVIFSNKARLANPAFDRVNVLLCRTLRGPLQRECACCGSPAGPCRRARLGDTLPAGQPAFRPQGGVARTTWRIGEGTAQVHLPTHAAVVPVRILKRPLDRAAFLRTLEVEVPPGRLTGGGVETSSYRSANPTPFPLEQPQPCAHAPTTRKSKCLSISCRRLSTGLAGHLEQSHRLPVPPHRQP